MNGRVKELIAGLSLGEDEMLSHYELEQMGIPMPDAFIRIADMLDTFNYTVDQAECIKKYCLNYIRMFELADKEIGELLMDVVLGLTEICENPVTEVRPTVRINKEGVSFAV